MREKPFLQHLREDNSSTISTIEILRRLNQATNGRSGPKTIMQKLWRELTYVEIFTQKALLIVAFMAIAIFLFFWLPPLL